MPQSMSLNLIPKQAQSLKQMQRLIMSPQMQQAIHLLQMPVLELNQVIEAELEQNPVLETWQEDPAEDSDLTKLEDDTKEASQDEDIKPESELSFDDHDFQILKQLDEDFNDYFAESSNYYVKRTADEEKLKTFMENSVLSTPSLFQHLMQQAEETFSSKQELAMAESIIGNFDESGFFKTPLKEIALLNKFDEKALESLLKQIQKFEPYGVGAKSLQESLLIQLECLGKKDSVAYRVIDAQYDNLLHNRIPAICKALSCKAEEIVKAIKQDISKLDLHPGALFSRQPAQPISPDVTIKQEGDRLVVVVEDDSLPPLRLNRRYMRMLEDETLSTETKDFIRHKVVSAKWLLRNIHQRNESLEKIANALIKRQKDFFINPEGKLAPLTMKTLADELGVHESTVARAVSNKYLYCPRGLIPLRSFFTNAYIMSEGEDISSKTVRDELLDIINHEDKRKPLSDEAISSLLKAKGIECARRTVAKYRTEMHLGNALQRKKYIP